ncbi:MAG TPA: STAS-like domain-containing protein [bacterium]|nr:STAS-like domain-containing protein [bacterium]HQL62655.1 STAS-like domain-containing protein [bacterium]
MEQKMVLSLYEIVGEPLCVASDDGQKVYDRLEAVLKKGENVTLSFRNVTTLTSAFLNSAIGQLYGTFSEEQLRSLLEVQDIQQGDLVLLSRVVETAKQYFKDPNKFNRAVQETLGDGNDGV